MISSCSTETTIRFFYGSGYGGRTSIEEQDVPSYPQYDNLLWGSATVIENNTSVAILNSGDNCRMIVLQNGKGGTTGTRDTKKLVKEIDCNGVVSAESKFYMMKYNTYLFFTNGDKLYRYNLLNGINSNMGPAIRPSCLCRN